MTDLLPCPFCGSPAEIRRDLDHRTAYEVGCTKCQVEIWAHTEQEAADLWNRRHKEKE